MAGGLRSQSRIDLTLVSLSISFLSPRHRNQHIVNAHLICNSSEFKSFPLPTIQTNPNTLESGFIVFQVLSNLFNNINFHLYLMYVYIQKYIYVICPYYIYYYNLYEKFLKAGQKCGFWSWSVWLAFSSSSPVTNSLAEITLTTLCFNFLICKLNQSLYHRLEMRIKQVSICKALSLLGIVHGPQQQLWSSGGCQR